MVGLQKILLVEDNQQLKDIYLHFLEQHGYEVATATDGDEALTTAATFKPELIFLDVMIPKRDGFAVLKLLRHDPRYGCTKTKIVLLTNLGHVSHVSKAVEQDMDGYVVKSEIVLSDLLDIIKSFE